ncbi:hypothetical protein [Actinoplanes sp. NPDC048796]|uniref:hypothetical protein n=1 Tax=Actinoplanes sp. NPDC048796 TaxID=3155640 RepID=UPI0034060102
MRRNMKLTALGLGLAGLLALAAYAAPAGATDLTGETSALTTVGLDSPEPSATASNQPRAKHQPGRAYLRKNTLHGEIVVQGKDGPRTLVVQRGTVTAAGGDSLSVKSTDGFTQTWAKAEKFTVRGDLKTGAEVGVAGRREGDKTVARLVIVKK